MSSPSPKVISLSILASGIAISAIIFFSSIGTSGWNTKGIPPIQNVYIKDNIQTIELTAKTGFSPEISTAKADTSTVLRITTDATFDCSSVISIPELKINKNLPNTGVTEIPLGSHAKGTVSGTCGMGMYPFTINFQ